MNKPMLGLLIFNYHCVSKAGTFFLVITLLAGVGYLITGWNQFVLALVMMGLVMFPTTAITRMERKLGIWDRFLLTAPVTRGGLLASQYVGALITAFCAAVVVCVFVFAGNAIHVVVCTCLFDFCVGFHPSFIEFAPSFGMPFLITGVFFPLASTRFGRDRESAILFICQFAAFGLIIALPMLGERLAWSMSVVSIVTAAVSLGVFAASYPITRAMYRRMDF